MVQVEKDVQVEVLDWGGTGRPVVLLAGLGDTAHVFDQFAPLLAKHDHVYGITRRGFGDSSHPATGYGVDRLGQDVVAVLDVLKLEKPILIGHPLAGEEMSWIANNAPARAAGLVYLDAGYPYAFYDASAEDFSKEVSKLEAKLGQVSASPDERKKQLIEELLQVDLPKLEHELRNQKEEIEVAPKSAAAPTPRDKANVAAFQAWTATLAGAPLPEAEVHAMVQVKADGSIGEKRADPAIYPLISQGGQQFTRIPGPVLAIFACPHRLTWPPNQDPKTLAVRVQLDREGCEAQAGAFRHAVPQARVLMWPNNFHTFFLVRPDDVLREVDAFIAALPQ